MLWRHFIWLFVFAIGCLLYLAKYMTYRQTCKYKQIRPSTYGSQIPNTQTFGRHYTMDVFQLAAGFYFLNACNYYMLCVKKYKVLKRPWRARRWWMLTIHKNRTKKSMENFFQEMLAEPSNEFNNCCRMSIKDFEFLLQKIGPLISKKDTKWRDSIPSKVRLAVTLRFLASGDSYKSLHLTFKISSQIISKIVMEVCAALYRILKQEVKLPAVEEDWLAVESCFQQRFPHCVGAIDGKHVVLQSPIHSGSEYYNYKGSFSIVLLALVNSNYCFMFADVVGCQGRISDGGVLKNSLLWHKMSNNLLRLPAPSPLRNGIVDLPYVFLGDGAFALHNNLMKPYPGAHQEGTKERMFNKKLSSARVVVENVFGILSSVFRVMRKPLLLEPEPAIQVVMACIVLHNFLIKSRRSSLIYNPPGTFDVYDGDDLIVQGSWRADMPTNPALRNIPNIPRRSPRNPVDIRNEYANYFYG